MSHLLYRILLLVIVSTLVNVARSQPVAVSDTSPVIERWMYAFNAAPCDRPAGAVFGTLGDDAGVDTRHAQHLIGWDTASLVTTNLGPSRYLVRSCRVTLTINRGNLFVYDSTSDDYRTYFPTNDPNHLPDTDSGRPVEMFGVDFRNGFDLAGFDQCSPFGTNAPAQRNAFAAGWSTNGTLIDVSNNVGKTNESFRPFEVFPFAIGRTTNAAPGEPVPAGATITFDLNLTDPWVLQYVQSALNAGRLRMMVTSIHTSSGPTGAPSYPDFVTHFNQAAVDPTRLELEATAVRDLDTDTDGLPDDWEQFYFGNVSQGGGDDSDLDGSINLDEFRAGTDPLKPESVLRLDSIARDGAGRTILRFAHAASHGYTIEHTENLRTWEPLINAPIFEPGMGVAVWADEGFSPSQRFYRLRATAP